MAFDSANLIPIGGNVSAGGGQRALWMYATTDDMTPIIATGYFNDAGQQDTSSALLTEQTAFREGKLNEGDVIIIVASDRTALVSVTDNGDGTSSTNVVFALIDQATALS